MLKDILVINPGQDPGPDPGQGPGAGQDPGPSPWSRSKSTFQVKIQVQVQVQVKIQFQVQGPYNLGIFSGQVLTGVIIILWRAECVLPCYSLHTLLALHCLDLSLPVGCNPL